MLRWINPRVTLLVVSVLLLLAITVDTSEPDVRMKRSMICCGVLFVLYLGVFLWPLRKAVRMPRLFGMLISLIAGWAATTLALVTDTLPHAPDEAQQASHPLSWARAAFVIAAGIAFYLFFEMVMKGFDDREEMNVTGQRPESE